MTKVRTDVTELKATVGTGKTVSFMRFPKGIQRELDVPPVVPPVVPVIEDILQEPRKEPTPPADPPKDDDGDGKGGKNPKDIVPPVDPPKDDDGDTGAGGKPPKDNSSKSDSDTPAAYVDGDDIIIDFDREDLINFNEAGDVLDAEGGKVILSKEDYDLNKAEHTPSDDDDNALSVVQTAVNVEVMGEDGTPKTYEQTAEGIKQYINDATGKLVETRVREEQDNFLNSNPHLKAFAEHLQKGGDPRSFHEDVETWDSVVIQKDSNEQHTQLVAANLIRNGYSEERANKMAKTLVDGGEGLTEATSALAELKAADQNERVQAVEAQNNADAEIKAKNEKYWNDIETTAKKRTLGSGDAAIKIPESEVNGFLKYLTEPVTAEGYTQEQLDRSNESMEDALLGAYLKHKSYNFSRLVDLRTRQQRVVRIGKMANDTTKGQNGVIVKRTKGTPHNVPTIDQINKD